MKILQNKKIILLLTEEEYKSNQIISTEEDYYYGKISDLSETQIQESISGASLNQGGMSSLRELWTIMTNGFQYCLIKDMMI